MGHVPYKKTDSSLAMALVATAFIGGLYSALRLIIDVVRFIF